MTRITDDSDDPLARGVMAAGGTSGGVTAPGGLAPVSAVFAGLCCTHYGYSLPLWEEALRAQAATGAGGIDTGVKTGCINPNSVGLYVHVRVYRYIYNI